MADIEIKTLADLKKSGVSPDLIDDSTLIVQYGRSTLYLQPDKVNWDGSKFRQSFKVAKEIKPERKPRQPKAQAAQAQAGKGKSK